MATIKVKLEREDKFGEIYRIYAIMSNLADIVKDLWEEDAITELREENEASLMDDMIEEKEELFKRLIRELEANKGLEHAKLIISSKSSDKHLLIVKIGEYINWRLLLKPNKVKLMEV
ncbi:hypothetical protein PAP_05995 [Palaeococcus pacificus DY20341]|uniref:Uncharacterized protein n=1 Tax=Palaeococcus pacificus DY20341 TaxID=1343739 RepID=A0A075LTG4_9EURY|nr:hypothetical protein [Palaeococcus pacificus]AIF69599.1 hypothetical protein PAP_05995 [Palaeococcus pacificus DY20341]